MEELYAEVSECGVPDEFVKRAADFYLERCSMIADDFPWPDFCDFWQEAEEDFYWMFM